MEEEPDTPSLVELLQRTAADRHLCTPDLSAPAAQEYLDTLQALPLKALQAEAGAITDAAGGVEGELTNLCYREYPTFISVHKCSAAVTSAFDDFSSSLGRLLDAVPALEDECRTFVRGTATMQDARAKAALVQEHQDKLFDLLEIPQLMDTCVRNGYYQEALELSAHTDSLLNRYPGVELVQDVAKEVDGVLQLMLAQLLALLREPIKLPALVKTVGYLRRLSIIGEDELGLAFLVSRLSNFRTQLGALERDRPDPVRYVRKYVDLFREHVFDIISQFSAIFEGAAGAAQLASFVGQCVDELVSVVAANVPKMNDAASLSSILVQLGYCALAFARVGLDFSALVTDPFADAVSSAFGGAVTDATKSLAMTLAQAEKGSGSPASALLAPEALPALLSADSPLSFVTWSGSLDILPDLAKFPPLAILVNAHLSALNSLRLLAPLHLHPALAATQCAALTRCTHAVAQYARQAVAMSDTMNPGTGHKRSNSGRAALIRRNTETQLTPEARTARRREAQRTCAAFADVWGQAVVPLLRTALDTGVFEEALDDSAELRETLETLDAWVRDQDVESPVKEGARTPNGSGTATPVVHEEMVGEPGEMTAVERGTSPVRSPSPVKASPVKERSLSPVKAEPARSPSPMKEPVAPSPIASPVKERSPSPVKPEPARSPSPVQVPSPKSPVKPSSPVKTSPLLKPTLQAPQFTIDTPSANATPAVATPLALATPVVETPPPVPTPEPEPEENEKAADAQAKAAETEAAKTEPNDKPEASKEKTEIKVETKPMSEVQAEGTAESTPPTTSEKPAPEVNGTADAEKAETVEQSELAVTADADISAVSVPEDENALSPVADTAAVVGNKPTSPPASAETTAVVDTPAPPSAPDATPPAASETPAEEADDDPAESTGPSRPPSPSGAAPSTSGGGKKKKKKNKKKK
ncbi:hypothetical protein CspHIS471_0106630 [Cutaneotrichosporon sp. HIS471]|nr:hypothetical protein CspHIS471_0106630 [Cutaneotrichosporon sp. HIS471]